MQKNILDALEANASLRPDKIIFSSEKAEISYANFVAEAKSIGCDLIARGASKKNVAVFIDKSVNCLLGMFGAMYANACYTIIDTLSPAERIGLIVDTFKPEVIITDEKNYKKAIKFFGEDAALLVIEEVKDIDCNEEILTAVRKRMCDTDPMYVLFTSGSTGVPKGTVICHRSVIDYAYTICRTFDIDENTVWGSQTPFYFSMSILDVFSTIVGGSTLVIIPKKYFSFPGALIEFLNDRKINSIYWVPTALNIVADFDTFSEIKPEHLKKVLFAGEVMPVKQLNYWIENLPDLLYANLYGPTEITDTCTYYIVDRHFENNESLPIGIPFDNCDVIVINDEGKEVVRPEDGTGLLYVRGSFLGLGYYNNPEKTAEVFVQNPLNTAYPELLYCTGDVVAYAEDGNILYYGRKDHQIKYMGHRIELGEIEAAASACENAVRVACVYDDAKKEIVMFYTGSADPSEMSKIVRAGVPNYMMPGRIDKLDNMPINMNGKIDRVKLKEEYL